jgi:hypothetical protein
MYIYYAEFVGLNCFSEAYNTIHIGKHLSDTSCIQNGLKRRGVLLPFIYVFSYDY